ncbi:peptidyl-prolyl cis-trans isomerase-like 4 [Planoprotostelium fungivorum]|uniref:peptidylprolyl isomerase n=1 Tax=Planoprotostelium fungivorum TaxID=1890364 RepID=A0A2P6NSE4_9EUKA|nr:peptidyl-prolyl cis-trans isomerase-like 4 [Planoprotostelium fungivorum]
MSVLIETSLGDVTIDLFVDDCPNATRNFLKLCKIKYYNNCLFHNIQKDFLIQTGDPTNTGKGGESVYGLLYGEQAKYFEDEIRPHLKHKKIGMVAMANPGPNLNGSQFYITTAPALSALDEKHTIFGEVVEGLDTLEKINDAYCDKEGKPLQVIRIRHVIILDDPFDDPKGLEIPDRSPLPPKEQWANLLDEEEFEKIGKPDERPQEEIDEELASKEAKSREHLLEIIGDMPDADAKPPDNVLFVCKLHAATQDEDLELIFSRFGPIKKCEIIRDWKTGDSLNYAFIEFENHKDCEAAFFKMDNVLIDDRRIHVDFSQSVSKQWISREGKVMWGGNKGQPQIAPTLGGDKGAKRYNVEMKVKGRDQGNYGLLLDDVPQPKRKREEDNDRRRDGGRDRGREYDRREKRDDKRDDRREDRRDDRRREDRDGGHKSSRKTRYYENPVVNSHSETSPRSKPQPAVQSAQPLSILKMSSDIPRVPASPRTPEQVTSSPSTPAGTPSTPSPKKEVKRTATTRSKSTRTDGDKVKTRSSGPIQSAQPTESLRKGLDIKPMPVLPEAPVFYPTEEEFKDPMKYIASIREIGRHYGIAKIIPPSDKWLNGKEFSKMVDYENFIFQTKGQSINQLFRRNGPSEIFLKELFAWYDQHAKPLRTLPSVGGQDLDLRKLYEAVIQFGGYYQTCVQEKWTQVCRIMRHSGECMPYILRNHYESYLLLYEYAHNPQFSRKTGPVANERQEEAEFLRSGVKIESRDIRRPAQKKRKMGGMSGATEGDDFGYDDGNMFTLNSFKEMADGFKKKWFPEEDAKVEDIEATFWHIVEAADQVVQVHYGSDLDVGTHGSGFPNDRATMASPNTSAWNMNLFPKAPGSLLSFLPESIQGVSVPMMYIGMLYSSFCWHVEDNFLYSINYMHHGAAKTWYGIPEGSCENFEGAMKKELPELFKTRPNLLFLLVTMFPPRMLVQLGIPIYHTLQKAGEIMLTFPKGYHAGFSHGFNCAESTNFALSDWFPYGRESVALYRGYNRSSVFSIEKLLCFAANQRPNEELRRWLRRELPHMRSSELYNRQRIKNDGVWKSIEFSRYDTTGTTPECDLCKYDCYLSALVCPCNPKRIVCLDDAHQLCGCPPEKKILLFRYTVKELNDMVEKAKGRGVETGVENPWETPCRPVSSTSTIGRSNVRSLAKRHSADDASKKARESVTGVHSRVGLKKLARLGGVRRVTDVNYDEPSKDTDLKHVLKRIVKKRRRSDGGVEYLIEWRGLEKEERSWVRDEDFLPPEMIGERPPTIMAFVREPFIHKNQVMTVETNS